jgi:CRISPR-associated protein Csx14
MAKASIPVDLLNPGQVFGCLGFLEAAETLLGNACGGFDWTNEADIRFHLSADGDENPVEKVLDFLAGSSVRSLAPSGSELSTEKWSIPTLPLTDGSPFPFPLPDSPATLPALLYSEESSQGEIVIDHWGDSRGKTSRDNVKFWAGAGGYPGAALAKDGLDLIRDRIAEAYDDPFNLPAEQSSSFRLDWRRDYIPLDIGFSLNAHAKTRFRTIGYPLVEILAAIGLTHARPEYISKLEYRYGVIGVTPDGELFDPLFLRASLGAPDIPFPQRIFRMHLGWPGKEGQARCITTVYEEVSNE